MKVAVVYIAGRSDDGLSNIAQGISDSLTRLGHSVELSDRRGNTRSRIVAFEYIFIVSEPIGLGSKLPARLREFLAQDSGIGGKRSTAVLRRTGLLPSKALRRLVGAMEGEGMVVNFDALAANAIDGAIAAETAPLERN